MSFLFFVYILTLLLFAIFIFLIIYDRVYIKDVNLIEKYGIAKTFGGGVFCSFLLTLILVLLASHFMHQRFFYYSYDCSFTILIQSLLLFYIAKSCIFHNSIINYLSSSVFAIYVLNYAYEFVDRNIFHITTLSNEWYYILAVLGESAFMVIIAFLIDQVVGRGVKCCLRINR